MDGPNQGFPLLRNMTGIVRLYVWQLHQFILEGFMHILTNSHTIRIRIHESATKVHFHRWSYQHLMAVLFKGNYCIGN